jgi:membrane protease YdiL (CAAX protease family)
VPEAAQQLGFGHISWLSFIIAFLLATSFDVVFGPLASWALGKLGAGSFDTGLTKLADLPAWYFAVVVVVVATAEELLYRAYAIERLAALTGSYWIAGGISLMAFGLAHAPFWGWGPAHTAFVSGGVVSVIYVWRKDVAALILAHVGTDLFGILIALHLARSSLG